jgi:hypothetical protein
MIVTSIIENLNDLTHTLKVAMQVDDYIHIQGVDTSYIQIKREPKGFIIDVWSSDESLKPAQTMQIWDDNYQVDEEDNQPLQAGDICRTTAGDRFRPHKQQENLRLLHRAKWKHYPAWVCFNCTRGTKSMYLEKNLKLVKTYVSC